MTIQSFFEKYHYYDLNLPNNIQMQISSKICFSFEIADFQMKVC